MFHLKPSTPADVVALQRQELLQQLQPDEATVQDVLGDATLIAGGWEDCCCRQGVVRLCACAQPTLSLYTGFDDPHVMQAVAEIANDPSVRTRRMPKKPP